jgi:ferritin-like metal-binding protein YciE
MPVESAIISRPRKYLRDAFVLRLREAYGLTLQLSSTYEEVAESASDAELRESGARRIQVLHEQVRRLADVFGMLHEAPRASHCRGLRGILDEVRAAIDDETSDPLSRDARLVAGCRRAVHYEIASYRTLRDWGRSLGMTRALPLFEQTLVEDCDADLTMASLAAAKPCPMQPPGHP